MTNYLIQIVLQESLSNNSWILPCELFPNMRTWLHSLYRDLHSIPASNFSISQDNWNHIYTCVADDLKFHSQPAGTSIPVGVFWYRFVISGFHQSRTCRIVFYLTDRLGYGSGILLLLNVDYPILQFVALDIPVHDDLQRDITSLETLAQIALLLIVARRQPGFCMCLHYQRTVVQSQFRTKCSLRQCPWHFSWKRLVSCWPFPVWLLMLHIFQAKAVKSPTR